MWGIISTAFLVVYILMSAYLGRRGWSLLGKSSTRFYRKMYWSLFGVLILSFPIAEFGRQYLPKQAGLWSEVWGWYTMLAVVYLFIVSSGYGTWGPPLRIGTQPEIVSVTLKFSNM